MKTTGSKYPVTMLPYSEKALSNLLAELLMGEMVGKKKVYNLPASFDTEASSFTDEEGNAVGLCYIWMFGINETVVYGRYLDEFVELVTNINRFVADRQGILRIYVHFLKYDFSFIKKLFDWDDVFIRGSREPLYARWRNIEFRDSLALAGGRSLKYIGENVLRRDVKKAVGDLDYDLIRTPQTPMTQQELHYCEMDIRVLNEYIREKIEDDGDITKIPYTNTGYVRNYVRAKCFENRGKYMDYVDGLTMTPDCYLQCEKAFGGGAVGPNIKYADGKRIERNLHSRDIKSSYPYVMATGYYPAEFFRPIDNKYANEHFEELVTNYCCLFRVEIFNLVPKTDYCYPISYSKCNEVIGCRKASGRVIIAAYVSINVTELDFETIRRFYDLSQAEEIRISRMRISPRGYLPKPIIESVLKFFHDKTTLDGVEGREKEYMLSKNMLNSIYGMMVEKIVREEYRFRGEFCKDPKDYVNQVSRYNENRNRFLFYPWGVWVTAHARFRLYDAIYNIGDDWRYCDTDSVKYIGDHDDYFNRVNEEARGKLRELIERFDFSEDMVIPTSPDKKDDDGNIIEKGEKKYLGVWEHEYDASRFKTIGAKRYLVEYATGKHAGEIALTVAGTNKEKTLDYIKLLSSLTPELVSQLTPADFPKLDTLKHIKNAIGIAGKDPFDIFTDDLVIPAEYAKRTVSKFIDGYRAGYVTDYTGARRWYTSESGVYVEPASYTFSITEEMLEAVIWLTHDGETDGGEI